MTVSFNERSGVVQARITDGSRVSIRLSTGIKIPNHLKFQKGKFIGSAPEAVSMNNELNRQRVKLTDLYMTFRGDHAKIKQHFRPQEVIVEQVSDESYDLLDLLARYIKLSSAGEIKSRSNRTISEKTLKYYISAIKALGEYAKYAGRIDLMDMSISPRDESSRKMEITERWNAYFRGFDNYMIDDGYNISTRANYLLAISIIVNYWKEKLYLQVPKIALYTADPNPIIVLEPEFVQHFLTNEKLYNEMTDTMKYTWEVCATILITTLRIDDAIKMSANDLHFVKDDVFLSKLNGKTREYTDVPIPRVLAKVFRENLLKHGRIYTLQNTSYYSLYPNVRKLFSLYPEMHRLATVKKFGVRGEEVTEVKPMYEIVHPHMLRKTAITTMIYYKVSERHIKFCSGHTDNSASFERYVAFVDRHFKSEVKEYYRNFLGE